MNDFWQGFIGGAFTMTFLYCIVLCVMIWGC